MNKMAHVKWNTKLVVLIGVLLMFSVFCSAIGIKHGASAFMKTSSRFQSINVDIMEGWLATKGSYPPVRNIRRLSSIAEKMLWNWKVPETRQNWYRDGWGRDILYITSSDCLRYVLASPGRDGKFDEDVTAYLWRLPRYHFLAFDQKDRPDTDFITANNCDIKMYSGGVPGRCLMIPQMRLVLMNLRDALQAYYGINRRYPESIDIPYLQNLVRTETKHPYELFGGDSNDQITYITSYDRKKYILGADWHDNKFDIDLRELVEMEGIPLERAASHLNDTEWVYHSGKLISSWPEISCSEQ